MSYVVIIRGPIGVGKSTVSMGLAKILGADYIAVDRILSEAGLDQVEGDIPAMNFLEANKILITRIERILKSGKPVVLDGNFYYKEVLEDLERLLVRTPTNSKDNIGCKILINLISTYNVPQFILTLGIPNSTE